MTLTSNNKIENNIVELQVSVSSQELKAATDKVFKKKVKTISVPGFRKGKAPRQIIETMYGKGVFVEDAVNELYPVAYKEAVEESGIQPVDKADIEVLDIDLETGFNFKAVVTVKPQVAVTQYKNFAVEKIVPVVTDSEIDSEIDRMRDRNARIVTIDTRPALDGDETIIDFDGFVDDVAFDGGFGENYALKLGSGTFIDTFEQQIIGHSIGDEFDVNVTFPEEYHAEDLAGKPVLFKVKLNEIKGKELPELDDEFVKDISEFDTVAQLKESIKTKISETKNQRAQDDFENALVDMVVENMQADIPECMFEQRIDGMVRDFEQRLSSQGMNIELYMQYTGMDMEAFRKTFREQSVRQVKIQLALEEIAKIEAFEATDEEVEAECTKLAEMYETDVERIKMILPKKDIMSDIKSSKAIDLIKDTAIVTEKAEEIKEQEDK